MTDNDESPRTGRTGRTPTRDDGEPMKMREMDHTPPVEGPNRTFERDSEGRGARPDGGHQPAAADAAEGGQDESDDDDEDRFWQTIGEMDHTPPVEGPNRTFERGTKTDDGEE